MASKVITKVECDECGKDSPAEIINDNSTDITALRNILRDKWNWAYRKRNGKMVDLCPLHHN